MAATAPDLSRTTRRVSTAVGDLHVESSGSGPVVVCWPSLFCDGRTLELQRAALATNHRVLVIDGAGHGRSGPPPRHFSLEDCARAVGNVLDNAEVQRATFLGCAWGGHVGAVMALIAPERLRRLILLNAPMNAWTGAQRLKLWSLYRLFSALGPRDFLVNAVTAAQLSAEVRAAHPEHVAAIADCVRHSNHAGLVVAVKSAMLDRPSLVERLPSITVPTLFITGADDPIYPVALAKQHATAIPGARFAVVPGSQHQSGLEKPDTVNALIADFLLQVEASN